MAKVKREPIKVEEFEHAYLVTGTAMIDEARKALFKKLGGKKWSKIRRMPVRPMIYKGRPAVAMYFAVGPGAERKYKP